MTRKEKVSVIIRELSKLYPEPRCALHFGSGLELLVATRLSAQCTDKRVNEVTPALFAKYKSAREFADADINELEGLIRSCGFYRDKAKSIKEFSRQLIDDYGGVIPCTVEELTKLHGVGRKTANLIVGELYGGEAYICDTHCIRLSNRLGLTVSSNPLTVEKDLRRVVAPSDSLAFCHRFVTHGREVCTARKPACSRCPLIKICVGKTVE